MNDILTKIILDYSQNAHWIFFVALLLAGLNIPVSADVIIIMASLLAATVLPDHVIHLYLSVFLGCLFSAWISYGVGRTLGPYLMASKLFSKLISPHRLEQAKLFHHKYGLWALMIGRFIPFGVRNFLFMSSGLSKIPFSTFLIRDLVACFTWSTLLFFSVYTLGQNYDILYSKIRMIGTVLLTLVVLGGTIVFWIKKKKKIQTNSKR